MDQYNKHKAYEIACESEKIDPEILQKINESLSKIRTTANIYYRARKAFFVWLYYGPQWIHIEGIDGKDIEIKIMAARTKLAGDGMIFISGSNELCNLEIGGQFKVINSSAQGKKYFKNPISIPAWAAFILLE